MYQAARVRVAAALIAAGAAALFVSLFLTWSSTGLGNYLVVFGAVHRLAAALPHRDAWHTYSVADILLAALAAGLFVAAVFRHRVFRIVIAVFALAGLAFCIQSVADPPKVAGVGRLGLGFMLAFVSSAGAGQTVAIVALAIALLGLALTVRARSSLTP